MDDKEQAEVVRKLMEKGFWDEAIALIKEYSNLAKFIDKDDNESSLLHDAACYDGASALINALIVSGANVNLRSSSGSTPLGNAIHSGYRLGIDTDSNIELLILSGADIAAFDDTGNPPLHAAIYERRPNVIRLLLEAGADPLQKNLYGDDVYSFMAWLKENEMAVYIPVKDVLHPDSN